MLKLIHKSPDTFYRDVLSQGLEKKLISLNPPSEDSFLSDFKKISSNLSVFRAQDHTLALNWTFTGLCGASKKTIRPCDAI